jgi:hypothetical protein
MRSAIQTGSIKDEGKVSTGRCLLSLVGANRRAARKDGRVASERSIEDWGQGSRSLDVLVRKDPKLHCAETLLESG